MSDPNSNPNSNSSPSQAQVFHQLKALTDAIHEHRSQIAAVSSDQSFPTPQPLGFEQVNQSNLANQFNALMQQHVQARLAAMNPAVAGPEADVPDPLAARFADLEKRVGDILQGLADRFLEMTSAIDVRLQVLERAANHNVTRAPQAASTMSTPAEAVERPATAKAGTRRAPLHLVTETRTTPTARHPPVDAQRAGASDVGGGRRKKRKRRNRPDSG